MRRPTRNLNIWIKHTKHTTHCQGMMCCTDNIQDATRTDNDPDVDEAIVTGNYALGIELSFNAGNVHFNQHSTIYCHYIWCFIAQNGYLNLVETNTTKDIDATLQEYNA
eukprot:897671_1